MLTTALLHTLIDLIMFSALRSLNDFMAMIPL